MAKWRSYKNGNYTCSIDLESGTKVRQNNLDNLTPAFAENCDVKITSVCDGECGWCYEGCTPNGKHADILNQPWVDTLRAYTELAIGGNDLSHPDLIPFLEKLRNKKIISNITVNQIHFEKHFDLIKALVDNKLIYGLGVSLREPTAYFIDMIKEFPNAVIHVIDGIVTVEQLAKLSHCDLKVLILGYKQLGRGKSFVGEHGDLVNKNMVDLYYALPQIIDKEWFEVVSFDNLALAQLEVKRLLSDDEWDRFYMGSDSEFTYYIDAVEEKFAGNSLAPDDERYDLLDSVDEMFEFIRGRCVGV